MIGRHQLPLLLGLAALLTAALSPAGSAQSPTPTATETQTQTPAATASPVETATETPTPTPSPTETATPAETTTATPAPTETASPAAILTPTPTFVSPTPTSTPTATPTTATPTPEALKAEEPTATGGASQETTREPAAEPEPKAKPRKRRAKQRNADGTPTLDNPGFTLALPGAAPIGVPNFFIDKFRVPPFLLSIYQAAGIEYGVRWEVLAAINEIETDYGRNLRVSSAGALGWMQFMPASWETYGVDANQDGLEDPYNPVDAIFTAARYLRAAGADQDLRKAIFAYNHADWYVESVLLRASVIGGLPSNLVGSLTGLTQARFPVYGKATYADDLSERERKGKRANAGENAAFTVDGDDDRRGIRIYSRRGAPAIAVNDGRIVALGETKRLGRYVKLQDAYGNTFTYAHLAKVAATHPVARRRTVSPAAVRRELKLPSRDARPTKPASTTERRAKAPAARASAAVSAKRRLFANPGRPNAFESGGATQLELSDFSPVAGGPLRFDRKRFELARLRKGSRIIGGTILGRVGKTSEQAAPHVLFEIRPAGRGAPRIDPKPILDGWKLLESTAIYRAVGRNPFGHADAPSIGQILLMSKDALARRVANNPRIEVYDCGRQDIDTGQIDRRVLATLEFLAASGFKPTVTSLKCGHSYYTKGGSVSHHSSGNAVDIAAVNGIPILGNQGEGSITDLAVQRLLTLQGMLRPDQIITLMTFEGADNTFAMSDHHDHIHVGWRPLYGTNSKLAKQVSAVLKPRQWIKLIDRLGSLDNPAVRTKPSRYAVKATKRASRSHRGD